MKILSGRSSNACLLLCSVVVLIAAGSAAADDKDDWLIGKIFMSREERVMLDKLRNSPQATITRPTNANSVVTTTAEPEKKTNPSGYILSSNGSPYRWENGHFRKTKNASTAMDGGGDKIAIVKHPQSAAPEEAPEVDSADPNQSGNCDADRPSDHDSEC